MTSASQGEPHISTQMLQFVEVFLSFDKLYCPKRVLAGSLHDWHSMGRWRALCVAVLNFRTFA